MSELALRLVDTRTSDEELPRLVASCDQVRVVHALPGRVRYHLPRWDGSHASDLQDALRCAPGVVAADVNPVTRNVLLYFDLDECGEAEIRRAVSRLESGVPRVVEGRAPAGRRRRTSAQRRANSPSTSRKRLEIVVGSPAASFLPHVPKILLLLISLFTTRTPLGLTLLGLDWLELLTRLNSEPV